MDSVDGYNSLPVFRKFICNDKFPLLVDKIDCYTIHVNSILSIPSILMHIYPSLIFGSGIFLTLKNFSALLTWYLP